MSINATVAAFDAETFIGIILVAVLLFFYIATAILFNFQGSEVEEEGYLLTSAFRADGLMPILYGPNWLQIG